MISSPTRCTLWIPPDLLRPQAPVHLPPCRSLFRPRSSLMTTRTMSGMCSTIAQDCLMITMPQTWRPCMSTPDKPYKWLEMTFWTPGQVYLDLWQRDIPVPSLRKRTKRTKTRMVRHILYKKLCHPTRKPLELHSGGVLQKRLS